MSRRSHDGNLPALVTDIHEASLTVWIIGEYVTKFWMASRRLQVDGVAKERVV